MRSELDRKFDAVAAEYEAQFGKPYVIVMHYPRSTEQHLHAMEAAMKENKPIEVKSPDPELDV